MECLRCGQCCTKAVITLTDVRVNDDPKGLGKWLQYHRCSIGSNGGNIILDIPIVCMYLQFNGETGQASCNIYPDRPNICRDYQCLRIQDQS